LRNIHATTPAPARRTIMTMDMRMMRTAFMDV
jgi:hypothetical protein